MVIITDTTGITVKNTIDDQNHARIGITETCLWIDGQRRSIRENAKPHVEVTINECQDLMNELKGATCLKA